MPLAGPREGGRYGERPGGLKSSRGWVQGSGRREGGLGLRATPGGEECYVGTGMGAGVCWVRWNLELMLSLGLEERSCPLGWVKGPPKTNSQVHQSWTSI